MDRETTSLTAHARDLGDASVDLTKANQVAAEMEDAELLRTLARDQPRQSSAGRGRPTSAGESQDEPGVDH